MALSRLFLILAAESPAVGPKAQPVAFRSRKNLPGRHPLVAANPDKEDPCRNQDLGA